MSRPKVQRSREGTRSASPGTDLGNLALGGHRVDVARPREDTSPQQRPCGACHVQDLRVTKYARVPITHAFPSSPRVGVNLPTAQMGKLRLGEA